MESPSANLDTGTQLGLDQRLLEDTIELPPQKTARKVDIYLPKPLSDWSGPALQQAEATTSSEDDLSEPLRGMLRPMDANFGRLSVESNKPQPAPKTIRSYARRSAKRGFLYTLLFVAALAIGATWLSINYDSLLASVLKNFQ